MRRTVFTALLATVCSLSAKPVKIHGYITDIESPKAFSIDDYKITTDDHLDFEVERGDYPDATFHPEDLRTGAELEVQGEFNDSTHELRAASIKVFINDNVRVKRVAVIEETTVFDRSGTLWTGVIHADGETINVNDQTHVSRKGDQAPQLSPGMSIAYEGYRTRSGAINATRLAIYLTGGAKGRQRSRSDGEAKLNSDGEISIHGVKYKLVPDAEAQSYVQRVGIQLVPRYYQQEFSGGSARKEPFEFYLVDNDEFNAHAFPNGTVLVNSGVFRVLTSEGQLAAVLGHEIAHATQEHASRTNEYKTEKEASGLEKGYAGGAGGYSRVLENQADRVGLEYMIVAGYDPREAAEVWTQVAHTAGGTGFFWDGHDDATTRRSYLLAEIRNNYSGVDYKAYVRNREEFDVFAGRFGGASTAQRQHNVLIAESQSTRPDLLPVSSPQVTTAEKRYGANAVTITSTPPGADVLLNGSKIGKTPLTLPTGNVGIFYTITVRRAGYMSWTGQLVSVPGRTSLPVELLAVQ